MPQNKKRKLESDGYEDDKQTYGSLKPFTKKKLKQEGLRKRPTTYSM